MLAGRLPVVPLAELGDAQVVEGLGLGGVVAGLPRGLAGEFVDDRALGPVAAVVEVPEQGDRQLGRLAAPAVLRGVPDEGDHGRTFAVQPLAGGCRVGQGRDRHRRGGGARAVGALAGQDDVHRGSRRGQVVAEQPVQRLARFACSGGKLAGVGAQQVVHGVTGRAGGLDQVGAAQGVHELAGLVRAAAGERRGGVAVERDPGMQAGEAERPGSGGS
jgi:hypothetical protein